MSCNEAAMAEEVPKRRGLACAGATCGPLIIGLQLLLALALCTLRLVLGLALQHAPQPLRLRSASSVGPVYLATFSRGYAHTSSSHNKATAPSCGI